MVIWCERFSVLISPADLEPATGDEMERVDGIGGLFFRAKDPEALARWYEAHLGVSPVREVVRGEPVAAGAGPTVSRPSRPTPIISAARSSSGW